MCEPSLFEYDFSFSEAILPIKDQKCLEMSGGREGKKQVCQRFPTYKMQFETNESINRDRMSQHTSFRRSPLSLFRVSKMLNYDSIQWNAFHFFSLSLSLPKKRTKAIQQQQKKHQRKKERISILLFCEGWTGFRKEGKRVKKLGKKK